MEIGFQNHIKGYNFANCLKRLYKEKKNIPDLTKYGILQDIAREMLASGIIIPNSDNEESQKDQVQNVAHVLREHLKIDSAERISGQWLLIYTKYFDCSADFLTGKIDTFNHDMIDATEKTGLSEKAIETIASYDTTQKELLESMATADNDILKHTLNTLFLTAYGMYYPTITIKNDSIGLDKTIPTNETKSFMLASAQNDFNEIITSVFNLYQPQFERLSTQVNEALKKELKKAKSTD